MTDFEKHIAVLDQLLSCVDKIKTRDEYRIIQWIDAAELKILFEGGNPLEIPGVVAYTEEDVDKRHFFQCQKLAHEFHTVLMELIPLKILPPADWLLFKNQIANRRFDQNRIAEIASQIVVQKWDIGQQQVAAGPKGKRPGKRSTSNGDAEAKLISAMTTHHKYDAGSCLNTEPVGNNELARLADVAKSTASDFLKDQFDGLNNYHRICNDPSLLIKVMKIMNGEIKPSLLLQHDPSEKSGTGEE